MIEILQGDCLDVLRTMPDESVQCCVTSPPYWGLRDYGVAGQLGLERTPEEYVAKMVEGFREVRRVLRSDGLLWLNLGDSYATGGGAVGRCPGGGEQGERFLRQGMINTQPNRMKLEGLKPKDLIGVPWRVAFALQLDGWYLRSEIIWAKPNGMPGSQQDRCTSAHESIFHLSKSERYFCDFDAIKTPPRESTMVRLAQNVQAQAGSHRANGGGKSNGPMKAVAHGSTLTGSPHGRHFLGDAIPEKERRADKQRGHSRKHAGFNDRWDAMEKSEQQSQPAMMRDVWFVSPATFDEAHFAVMPHEIARRCILAGSKEGDTILDPFNGAGTTGLVATRLQRNYIGIELNPEYVEMAKRRIEQDQPLFNSVL